MTVPRRRESYFRLQIEFFLTPPPISRVICVFMKNEENYNNHLAMRGQIEEKCKNEPCIYQMLKNAVERKMVQFVSKNERKKNRFVFIEKYDVIRSRNGRFLK